MSTKLRLRRRREPAGARPVRVHITGLANRRQLVFAAAYVRHLLAATTGPVEVVVRPPAGRRGSHPLTSGEIGRALPEDPLLSLVRRSDARRKGTRTVLLSMDRAAPGPYLRLLGAERRRAWVVSVESEPTSDSAQRRGRGVRSLGAAAGAGAQSATWAVLSDELWSLARRDRTSERGWRLNDLVAQEFRRVVQRSGTPRRSAVYLPGEPPVTEAGSPTTRRAEVDAVAAACDAAGLGLQVRPAPGDDPAAYDGLNLIEGDAHPELDPRVVDAAVVLGRPSATLLLLAAVHGVPAIQLVPEGQGPKASPPRTIGPLDAFVPQRSTARNLPPLLGRLTQ